MMMEGSNQNLMIFLRYESFSEYIKRYPITSVMITLNLVMYVMMVLDGGSKDHFTMIKFGALYDLNGFNGYGSGRGEWWRYFASIFLHFDLKHLLFNSFALFIFAPPIERLLGSMKYAVFFLGSGFLGNVLSEMIHAVNDDPMNIYVSAGASGAVYGVYGAFLYLILFHRHVIDEPSRKTIQTILIVGMIYSIISPYIGGGNIGIFAHLGGLIGGFLLFALFFRKNIGA